MHYLAFNLYASKIIFEAIYLFSKPIKILNLDKKYKYNKPLKSYLYFENIEINLQNMLMKKI